MRGGGGVANSNIISSRGGSPVHIIHDQPNYDSVAATSYNQVQGGSPGCPDTPLGTVDEYN